MGILPNGTVTACGWALDDGGEPLPGFKLGKLPEDNFGDILKIARDEMGYGERKDYCRIMHYLEGVRVI